MVCELRESRAAHRHLMAFPVALNSWFRPFAAFGKKVFFGTTASSRRHSIPPTTRLSRTTLLLPTPTK